MLKKTQQIETFTLFHNQAISAGSAAVSEHICLDCQFLTGKFSLQARVAGDGEARFDYELSNNLVDFVTGASSIATGVTKTSGPGGDGKVLFGFTPEIGEFIRIKVAETGSSNPIIISVWLTAF